MTIHLFLGLHWHFSGKPGEAVSMDACPIPFPTQLGGGVSSDSLKIKQAKEKKALAGDSVFPAVLKPSSVHVDGWD